MSRDEHPIALAVEMLSDNSSPYIARATQIFAGELNRK